MKEKWSSILVKYAFSGTIGSPEGENLGWAGQQKTLGISKFVILKSSTLPSKILLLSIYAGEGEMKRDEVRWSPPDSRNEGKSSDTELER